MSGKEFLAEPVLDSLEIKDVMIFAESMKHADTYLKKKEKVKKRRKRHGRK